MPDSLVQIVDAAMAEAVRKAGDWIACRPGCCECCMGPFPIAGSDAESAPAPSRGAAVMTNEPCPVLDPATGTCDLYTARP